MAVIVRLERKDDQRRSSPWSLPVLGHDRHVSSTDYAECDLRVYDYEVALIQRDSVKEATRAHK